MPQTPNLESANNAGFLWPSIADAVDTFLRRRHNNADAYERVWRLIHVWEATEITLALAVMSRVRHFSSALDLLRRQREFFYGKSWDNVTQSFKSIQGAADGGIDQWINILDEIAKGKDLEGRFLCGLSEFLSATRIDIGTLLTAWAKACDVPQDFRRLGPVDARTAMRYVNSFRNRFAHVPFPHDALAEVSDALESATEELFSIPPLPASHEKEGRSSPLTGAFRVGRCFLHGSQLESLIDAPDPSLQFVFPCRRRGDGLEAWPAGSFVHIDSMMRPHILTRVKGLDVCEYTRFRAEANAVLVLPNAGIAEKLPDLAKSEYQPEQPPDPPTHSDGETTADALEAIRSEDYDTAIKFFEQLSQRRPEYHVGWLRLGYARREKAVRIVSERRDEALSLLQLAVEDLRRASAHADQEYRASAHYERSKAFYHLARFDSSDQLSQQHCKEEAIKASELSDQKKYQTWLEHLETWAPWKANIAIDSLGDSVSSEQTIS